MSALEHRLRRELPELADALMDPAERAAPPPDLTPGSAGAPASSGGGRRPSARTLATGIAAACVVALVGGLFAVSRLGDADHTAPSGSGPTTPSDFGVWRSIPDAPIDPRPYAVSAWIGSEAVFWAGSSLSRGFAYSDGAAFDPASGTWRTLTVPGWGHPGLAGVAFDGDLYALAKGGGTRFDPVGGSWVDLPQVEDMYLAAAVATDDAVWGLGPTSVNPAGQPDIALARYDPATDTWNYGGVFEGTDDTAEIIAGLSRLDTQVLWDGTDILAWNGSSGGIAVDPTNGAWRTVPAPATPSGAVSDGRMVATDSGLALVAEVDRSGGRSIWDVAVRTGDGWTWRGSRIPIASPDTVTTVAAGEWIVLFSALQSPITVHTPTGEWKQHDEGPLGGLTAPNAVWTGGQLIVWGGVATSPPDEAPRTAGAIWTPPAASPGAPSTSESEPLTASTGARPGTSAPAVVVTTETSTVPTTIAPATTLRVPNTPTTAPSSDDPRIRDFDVDGTAVRVVTELDQLPDHATIVRGRGTLIDHGDGPRMCMGYVAESNPPQCDGPIVDGLEMGEWAETVEGVSFGERTVDVSWPPVVDRVTLIAEGPYETRVAVEPPASDPRPFSVAEVRAAADAIFANMGLGDLYIGAGGTDDATRRVHVEVVAADASTVRALGQLVDDPSILVVTGLAEIVDGE